MARSSPQFDALIQALKVSVATLRETGLRFMLGGSVAAWARGGPEPQNDLDLMVAPDQAEAALEALAQAGMRTERPPEEWLFKAWHGDVLIDLIFRPSGLELTHEAFERADTIALMAVATPVMALEDVLVTMLCAIDEHSLDYTRLVAIARALREQIPWPALKARTADSPYAAAFFAVVEGLGIAPAAPGPPVSGHGGTPRIRVVPAGS